MIITCDSCTKRYVIAPETLGDQGRLVRCIACGHSWKVSPVKESVLDLFPEDSKKTPDHPRRRPWFWVWSMLFLCLLMGIGGIVAGRGYVIRMWPATLYYYKALGFSVEHPGVGLSFQKITVVPMVLDQKKSLVIKGTILNTTNEVKYLPSLKVKAFGKCALLSSWEKILNTINGVTHTNPHLCMVHSWKHKLPETRLFPGEKAYFETFPHETNSDITDLTIGF